MIPPIRTFKKSRCSICEIQFWVDLIQVENKKIFKIGINKDFTIGFYMTNSKVFLLERIVKSLLFLILKKSDFQSELNWLKIDFHLSNPYFFESSDGWGHGKNTGSCIGALWNSDFLVVFFPCDFARRSMSTYLWERDMTLLFVYTPESFDKKSKIPYVSFHWNQRW